MGFHALGVVSAAVDVNRRLRYSSAMAAKKKPKPAPQGQLELGAPATSAAPLAPAPAPATSAKGARPVLYLVDGSGYIFRAFYAIRRMTASNGQATNAVFGFTTMLLKVLKEHAPSHIAIAFDPGGKNFRHELYPDYKANRSAPPEDLPPQIPLIHQLVEHLGITKVVVKGFEADDVLGTLARRAEGQGYDVVIITGDKDLMQLVDEHTSLIDELRMQKGSSETSEIRREQVIAKFGVPPERVVDVLALAGDSSDNVPGVRGIGEKTATELVNQWGDLESVLAHADDVKQPSRREKLKADAEAARLSKRLVTIREDVPLDLTVDELRYRGPDRAALLKLFNLLEFRRIINDPFVRGSEAPSTTAPSSEAPGAEHGEAPTASTSAPTTAPVLDRSGYRTVLDAAALREVALELGRAPRFAVRTEVDVPGSPKAALVGVAVAWAPGAAAWLPTAELGADALRAALAPVLADRGKQVIAHEGKTDQNALVAAGYPPFALGSDPMIASYLLDADADNHSLANLARRALGHAVIDADVLFGTGKNAKRADQVPYAELAPYEAEAADCTLRLAALLDERVEAAGLASLYKDLELPLEAMLGEMERLGIRVDPARLQSLSDDFATTLRALEQQAHELAGRPFNLDSPKQVAELLFQELALPVIKRVQDRPSTDASVLEELKDKHPLPGVILEHRTIAKLKGTYVDTLPTLLDERGRVHTTFNQAVAATGRLSSSNPNLQNIPVRTALGRKIRDAFIADDGKLLVSLDYSQIELRILAHVTEDPVLVGAFQRDEDIHQRTASEVFQVPLHDVTKDQRNAAKAINFGLLYGMGVQRLARELGVPRAVAKEYHDAYNDRLVGVRDWQSKQRERALVDKETRTLLGRRRTLRGIDSKNGAERARAERLAINTPIQGSAADIMKRAMLDADRALKKAVPRARILLQVHDELVLEAPEGDAARAMAVAGDAMRGAFPLAVPLKVDGRTGRTWNDAH
ncbi:MAG: DNA polymerase I [Deltaproteobacteria bacterium]|nr:DNA polymerase I [Deltaproteobacteria bacterium]